MNCSSLARQLVTAFLDPVYIKNLLFLLPGKRPKQLSSVFWMSKTRPPHPAALPPRCVAPPRPAPSGPWDVRVLDSTNTCRVQAPDIPWAGRGGAAPGGATGLGWAGQDGTPTGRFAQEATVPVALQGIENNCPECLFGSTNKRNPM